MKLKWDKKYINWGVMAFLVIVSCISFFWIISEWPKFIGIFRLIIKALSPFIYGLIIAYLLNKIMIFFENGIFIKPCKMIFRKNEVSGKKLARILSIFAAQILAWGTISGLLVIALPQIYDSIVSLVAKMPTYIDQIVSWADKFIKDNPALESSVVNIVENFADYFTDWVQKDIIPQTDELISNITGGVLSFLTGILNILIGIIISIYILFNKETFRAQSKKILYAVFKPRTANGISEEIYTIQKAFGNFFVGTLIDALIVGIICYIFLSIMNMPYVALVSLIIGVTNIIPVFGPFIGAIPSACLMLLESPTDFLIFVIFILVLQQVDGNIINPRIHSSSSGLSGFWIMFAILFFGKLFGLIGMILGIPTFSVIYDAVRRYNQRKLLAKDLPIETSEYKQINYIDPLTNKPVYYKFVPEEPAGSSKPKRPGKASAETADDQAHENTSDPEEKSDNEEKDK